jgi:hypothetical protein
MSSTSGPSPTTIRVVTAIFYLFPLAFLGSIAYGITYLTITITAIFVTRGNIDNPVYTVGLGLLYVILGFALMRTWFVARKEMKPQPRHRASQEKDKVQNKPVKSETQKVEVS